MKKKLILNALYFLLIFGCQPNNQKIKISLKNQSSISKIGIIFSTNEENFRYKFVPGQFEFDTVWTLKGRDSIDGHYKLEIISNDTIIAHKGFGYFTNGMVTINQLKIVLTDSMVVYTAREFENIYEDSLHFAEEKNR